MEFKDIIRHIHPDINTGVVNAGDKIALCVCDIKTTP